jgi:hypothetical protein
MLVVLPSVVARGDVAASSRPAVPDATAAWEQAASNGRVYAECARGARRILHGWIDLRRDPATQLYTRGGEWNYQNEAADHYSSLVLMAYHLEPSLNEGDGTLRATLLNSIRLCATASGVPASYNLRTMAQGGVDVGAVCEWLRDGLLRITDLIGTDNDWFREFVRLTDAVLAEAERRGGISTIVEGAEDEGNLIQVLARLAVMSGHTKYLDVAETMADRYLLADPLKKIGRFSFVDHGCELVPGLAELFVVECKLNRPRAKVYREPLQRLLDRLLEVGRFPESGLWYCRANLQGPQEPDQGKPRPRKKPAISGSQFDPDVPHCWGYVLFAYENYDRATGENRYRAAVEKPMRWLTANRSRFDELKDKEWPWNFAPGCFGDSYESMVILWSRYGEVPGVPEWLDWTTHVGGLRREATPEYGPGVGGHTDGCIGRNLCAHMMLQSQGVRAIPYQDGVECGAVRSGDSLHLLVRTREPWTGRLCFDRPRNVHPLATMDWARINEMPQWYVVEPGAEYAVSVDDAAASRRSGESLIGGIELEMAAGAAHRIVVRKLNPA